MDMNKLSRSSQQSWFGTYFQCLYHASTCTVPVFNSCTKCLGLIHDRSTDFRHNWKYFDSQDTWVVDVLGLSFDMLSMCVCTTWHWQTSDRLVQGINVSTVGISMSTAKHLPASRLGHPPWPNGTMPAPNVRSLVRASARARLAESWWAATFYNNTIFPEVASTCTAPTSKSK